YLALTEGSPKLGIGVATHPELRSGVLKRKQTWESEIKPFLLQLTKTSDRKGPQEQNLKVHELPKLWATAIEAGRAVYLKGLRDKSLLIQRWMAGVLVFAALVLAWSVQVSRDIV